MTTKKTSAAKAPAKAAAAQSAKTKVVAAKTVGANLSEAEIAEARKQGAIEAEKEAAKASYTYATDGNLPGDPDDAPRTFPGYDDIMQYEPLLNLGIEAFEAAVALDADAPIPDEKVYGLLALERNGRNRTPYIKAGMNRLGLKASELPGGGPDYTNDVVPITKL
ncbi:MAG: hypothetical protein V4696_00710 [Pseudomonadota bacterium]